MPGRAELLVDQRHLHAGALRAMLAEATALWESAAASAGCSVKAERIFSIEPVPFDPGLVAWAARRASAAGGRAEPLPSGALHDAAEIGARRAVGDGVHLLHGRREPLAGGGHAEADLARACEAYGALAERVIEEGRAVVKRVRVVVHGEVQGVFFRDTVCGSARERGRGRLGAKQPRRDRGGGVRGGSGSRGRPGGR